MTTTINQLISKIQDKFEFLSRLVIPVKFEISLAESAALFGCGFVTYGILSRLFKKIKNVQLEKEVRNQKALRIKDEERHEQQLEDQTECYRILRQMDSRKISKAESRCSDLAKAYRALEEHHKELEQHCEQLEELEQHCEQLEENNITLEKHYNVLKEQFNELNERYQNAISFDEESNVAPLDDDEITLSEEADECECKEDEEEYDECDCEDEDDEIELKIKEEVQVQPQVERRLWSNAEKADGTYARQLPDGFQAYLNSCKQTMNLTYQKGESKEDDRWVINDSGNAYPSLNQARYAFFGNDFKNKQSVWLSVRSAEDGRSLRNVIEGN